MRAILILFALLASPLAAQSPDPLLEQERLNNLEARTNRLGTLEQRSGAPDPGPAQAAGGPCFDVAAITVEGATLLTPAQIAAITARYVPACLQGANIQAVMREIDATYADQGYITTRTYIPPQNLASGTLVLTVLEGTVEGLLLTDGTNQITSPRGERQLATAFPGGTEGLFQLRDFEQGLDQMNRLKSVDATLQLQPGEEPGGSYVVVQRVQDDPLRGYLRLDDLGADGTGRRKLSFDVEMDDLFGANDTFTLGYVGSRNTNAINLTGSVPYGYFTYSGSLSYSEYLQPLSDTTELFGRTRAAGLDVTYVASRDQFTTTEVSAGLSLRKSDRFINDLRLTPQNLSSLDLGVTHLRLNPGERLSFDATLSLGTGLFNADASPTDDPTAPEPRFVKLGFGAQRQAALSTLGTLVSDLRGQISGDILYGSEQIAIGSYSTVRGYDQSVAAGDSGYYVRNDLYLATDALAVVNADLANRLQPYVFMDYGLVRNRAESRTTPAAGFGLGASYYADSFTVSGLIGAPLIEDGEAGLGKPVIQLRVDFTTF